MTWFFLLLAVVVVVATALAVAGRWQPEGLEPGAPHDAWATREPVRFDVVLRGYRMDQVDEELARLHGQLESQRAARLNAETSGIIGTQALPFHPIADDAD